MRRMLASMRRWWRSRVTVEITLTHDSPPVAVSSESWPQGALFSDRRPVHVLRVGDRRIVLRVRWWDTEASLARRMRREIARGR